MVNFLTDNSIIDNVIVSMCTENYNEWIHYFYNGIRRQNKDVKIIIYLINYDRVKANLLRSFFLDVEFIDIKGSFAKKPTYNLNNERECVTHLKGTIVRESFEKYKCPILWVDITALIRTDLTPLLATLAKKDVMLIRRDFKNDKGLRVMAAEIFGINSKQVAEHYEHYCLKDKDNWYIDQLSLCEILQIPHLRLEYIPFGEYCNFYYEEDAKTWSDRGKTGNGCFNQEDKDYEQQKFYDDLKDTIDGFEDDFKHYTALYDDTKPKLMCYIDETFWCYYTTAMKLCKYLSKTFHITIIRNLELDKKIALKWEGDIVWARCGSHRVNSLIKIRPELAPKVISTITTGGDLLQSRIDIHLHFGSNNMGVLTQNNETGVALKGQVKHPVHMIPNGVDIDKFTPVQRNPMERYNIGFAARHKTNKTDKQKGYTDYYVAPVSELKLDMLEVNSDDGFVEHTYMPKFYDNIDILIQASDSEGCSNTIHEAMSCGIPCIITKVGYHGEVCKHMENVVFVNRDKEEIKKALLLLQDKEVYTKISEGARKFALEHSWKKIADKFKSVFLPKHL